MIFYLMNKSLNSENKWLEDQIRKVKQINEEENAEYLKMVENIKLIKLDIKSHRARLDLPSKIALSTIPSSDTIDHIEIPTLSIPIQTDLQFNI